MTPNPVHRLPAALEAAVQSLKLAAREATERTVESLGMAALAATHAFQRDGLLEAQFELNRKSAVFALSFNDAFDERVLREVGPRTDSPAARAPAPAAWEALSLVEDREVEAQISAERFGMEIAHACEWELRELNAYIGSLLGYNGSEKERNPLRPELVGHAMVRAVEAVSERAEIRQVLTTELSRSLGTLLRLTYARIVDDLRRSGVQPLGLSVRSAGARSTGAGTSGFGASSRAGPLDGEGPAVSGYGPARHTRSGGLSGSSPSSSFDSSFGGRRHSSGSGAGFGPSTRAGTPLGHVDPQLMSLIRRLSYADGGAGTGGHEEGGAGWAEGPASGQGWATGSPLPNLIRAHRDELRQASTGSLDHMVIDVIGSLFDQILSDPKVPPQMARQIARLQLPVLRAALGDPSFFSSRRHPVRRFINRIASLGAAFEDYSEEGAQRFLATVRALVQEVVEGDFEQIEVYEQKLAALEGFVTEQARSEVQARGNTAELLSAKEDELRLRQLYAQRLEGDLKGLAAPAFVRDFISRVWSQVLLRAEQRGGAGGELLQRMKRAGRELFMSVQPKATPAQRKQFLAELPKLMQDLTEGMNLIQWPETERRAFFGRLMPAHAETLKAPGLQPLEINLMARQVEGVLEKPLPSRQELDAARADLPVLTDEISAPAFSAEEARAVGLMDEAAVDWNGQVDIDLSVDAAEAAEAREARAAAQRPAAPGLPAASDAAEPTEGAGLADSVQIGFAYRMHLEGSWQKVRLAHVSDARSFFVFTHGSKQRQTVSLTRRMLVRLCETGRLRAFESAYLLERATARARRQLAAAGSAASTAAP